MLPRMKRALIALVLLAACGKSEPYHCAAVVSGAGSSADGTYQCTQPPQGVYTPSSGTGQISGFAFAPNGLQFSFIVSFPGEPVAGTYTESSLPAGATANVAILGQGANPLWEPGSFTLTVRTLNAKNTQPLAEVWPEITGTLTATLKPVTGNPSTTNATVSMSF
jgi:hypothetical protein